MVSRHEGAPTPPNNEQEEVRQPEAQAEPSPFLSYKEKRNIEAEVLQKVSKFEKDLSDLHAAILKIDAFEPEDEMVIIDGLKKEFKELTGQDWTKDFSFHEFIVQVLEDETSDAAKIWKQKKQNLGLSEERQHQIEFAEYIGVYDAKKEKYQNLRRKINNFLENNPSFNILPFNISNGLLYTADYHQELVDGMFAEEPSYRANYLAERKIDTDLVKLADRIEQTIWKRKVEEWAAENPKKQQQLKENKRKAFLVAQEDLVEFDRSIFVNPITKKRKREALVVALEAAKQEYNEVLGRENLMKSHDFLNEYNAQIDEEVRIRSDRQEQRRAEGVFGKLKDTFYGAYKTLGDLNLDRIQRERGNDAISKTAAFALKFASVRTTIGMGLIATASVVGSPVVAAWRAAAGVGAGMAMYEGLKAGSMAHLQGEAQKMIAAMEGPPPTGDSTEQIPNVNDEAIYDMLQQIRVRAALDGKNVTDEAFSLHTSFVRLQGLLENRHKNGEGSAENQEEQEEAEQKKQKIQDALDKINKRFEKESLAQGDKRRGRVLVATGTTVTVALLFPQIAKGLGWGAEKIANWWSGGAAEVAVNAAAIAEAAVASVSEEDGSEIYPFVSESSPLQPVEASDTASAGVDDAEDDGYPTLSIDNTGSRLSIDEGAVPEVAAEDIPLTETNLTVTLESGQGAYHAVNRLFSELSDDQMESFVQSIQQEHPEWVQVNEDGMITNVEEVLTKWREEAVQQAVLDSGDTVSLYNSATGEYGVMLHPGAQFEIQFTDNGPRLHLMGEEGKTFSVRGEQVMPDTASVTPEVDRDANDSSTLEEENSDTGEGNETNESSDAGDQQEASSEPEEEPSADDSSAEDSAEAPSSTEAVEVATQETRAIGDPVTLERGQGAYQAFDRLVGQLNADQQQAFARAIVENHEGITAITDDESIITNVDEIFRAWRQEAVQHAVLDTGETASLYNPVTGEYGVMLHTGAEFTLEIGGDGSPQLHLNGSDTFTVVDTPFVLESGQLNSVGGESTDQIVPTSDTDTRTPTYEASVTEGEDIAATESKDIPPVEHQPMERITLPGGRYLEFQYNEQGELTGGVEANLVLVTREVTAPLLVDDSMRYVNGNNELLNDLRRNAVDGRLRAMFVYDEALRALQNQGMQNTSEYQLLQNAVRSTMHSIARQKAMDVQNIFTPDVLRQYGFKVLSEGGTEQQIESTLPTGE